MGPIAELAAPLLAPMLQPIMQDVEKAVGGVIGSAGKSIEGLLGGQGGQGGILGQLFGSLNPLQQLMGGFQNQGMCPAMPFPFSQSGLPSGILNNPFSQLPNFGSGFGGSGGGGVTGIDGNQWSDQAANAAGGESYSQLQSDLQSAEKSGDPAKIAAATANIGRYDNFVQAISNAEKKEDTQAAIIANLK
jgi:hypothetical protein